MTWLDDLGQAAAVILLIELLVMLIIFLALAGGLAFGLWWVRGKAPVGYEKVNGYLPLARKYTHQATDMAAMPLIKTAGFVERIAVTLDSLRRSTEAPAESAAAAPSVPQVAAEPVERPETTSTP